MKGSVLIITLFIMAAMSMLLITAFAIADTHLIITRNNNMHQEVYYLAESGMGFAQNELYNMVVQVHEECMDDFQWDPLQQPMYSMQESARKHIENSLGPRINKKLLDMGYLNNFPIPEIPGIRSDSKMDIRIRFTDIYRNPSRLLISSRADMGKIRRRIDAEVYINKVSKVYDSFLLNKALLIGNDIYVVNGSNLESFGAIHVQGGLHVANSSRINFHELAAIREEINIINDCEAFFDGEVICSGLHVEGETPSILNCSNDVYSYGILSVDCWGNIIQISGKLYVNPEEKSLPAGISATNGGIIQLKDEVFINGTLQYVTENRYLFGMEHIPIENNYYHSSESIGGGNHHFYFPDSIPEHAYQFFTPDFADLSRSEQGELIYAYLSTLPDSEEDLEQYLLHLEGINQDSIQLETGSLQTSHISGLIFANGQVMKPFQMAEAEVFFEGILRSMKLKTAWDYYYQLNSNTPVPFYNAIIEGNYLSVIDPDQPVICIMPEVKDLILPAGEYRGIIMTNGSICIPSDADVEFTGLLIAGENLVIEGSLILQEDKDLILNLLSSEDDSLRKFFRIEREKPLFEVVSCKEVLYNAQW
ncbi:MAG TPA: hypothetical protein GXZ37_05180 [Clostridiales bacterium]|nr:hypothetical protein [Clostridiales bacterium]